MKSKNEENNLPASTLDGVLETIQLLAMKSTQGGYIYRGEPECYDRVSSTLYRAYPKKHAEQFDIHDIQREIIKEAKEYIGEEDEFEILTQLQHYGGKTNLIDFTYDYLIALYFACDGYPESDGRVFMLQNPGVVIDYRVRRPNNPPNRVIAQKSVFVESSHGFVEPDDIVIIPYSRKQPILEYLRTRHGLSTRTIYNDLMGYIKVQELHNKAYLEFHEGLSKYYREEYDEAIAHYSKAINFNPQMVNAYGNRGIAHRGKGEIENAIHDFDRALAIDPNHAGVFVNRGNAYLDKNELDRAIEDYEEALRLSTSNTQGTLNNLGNAYHKKGEFQQATQYYTRALALDRDNASIYYNRGDTWLYMAEWEKAKSDLTNALNRGFNISEKFCKDYGSIENFEKEYGAKLPQDIVDILR